MLKTLTSRFINQNSLKSRIFVIVGLTLSILLGSIGSYHIYSNWTQGKSFLVRLNTEDAKVEATDIKMRIYRAIGVARTMSMSADFMLKAQVAGRDSILATTLNNLGQRLSHYNDVILYQSAFYSFDSHYLPGDAPTGRKLYLATNDKSGVAVSSKPALEQNELDRCIAASEQVQKATVSAPYKSTYANGSPSAYVVSVTSPIISNGQVVGSAGVDVPLDQIQKIVSTMNIQQGASSFLVASNGEVVAHSDPSQVGKKHTFTNKDITTVLDSITNGSTANRTATVDADGELLFMVPVQMDQINTTWALCVSIPKSVLFKDMRTSIFLVLLAILIGIAISLYLSNKLSLKITNPINQINSSIAQLAKGEIKQTQKLTLESKTEIGQIATAVNQMIDGLDKSMRFASEIGNANFNAEYNLLSDNDDLGHSLLDMKESLLKAKEQEQVRKEEEMLNSWANEGLAQFANILRSNHSDIKELSFQIISNLVKYLKVNQGGIFIQDDQENNQLNMTACFAYNRRKMLDRQVEVGEGLVGRCFAEAEPIYLLDIPQDYIRITSGLGDTQPRSLLLMPLKINEEVNGVVELASIEPIEEYKIKFVKKVAESIAATLNSVRINERTSQLLDQTKMQGEEMAAAEEEMRQNLEELQSTQEEMNRVQEDQKSAMEKIMLDNQMFDALLHSTSEYVFFKDNTGRYIKVSNTVMQLLNIDNIDEIVGKTAFDLYPLEMASNIDQDDKRVLSSKVAKMNISTQLSSSNGTTVNVTEDKYPVLSSDGQAVGIISIYKGLENMEKGK